MFCASFVIIAEPWSRQQALAGIGLCIHSRIALYFKCGTLRFDLVPRCPICERAALSCTVERCYGPTPLMFCCFVVLLCFCVVFVVSAHAASRLCLCVSAPDETRQGAFIILEV